MPARFYRIHFFLPIFGLSLVAWAFRATDWDPAISSFWYMNNQWFGQENLFLDAFYQFGTAFPNLIFALAVAGLLLSPGYTFFRKHRADCAFVASCYLLGPGLLVNGILKQHYPRTRPYDLELFGGQGDFCPVLSLCAQGESFSSGHVAVYAFLGCFHFILKNKTLVRNILLWTPVLGLTLLMSLTRVSQGGHFASDALFSMGLVHAVNAGIYWIFRRRGAFSPRTGELAVIGTKRRLFSVVFCLAWLGFVSLLGLMSFNINRHFSGKTEIPEGIKKVAYRIKLDEEDIRKRYVEGNTIRYDFWVLGLGLPWSDYFPKGRLEIEGDQAIYTFTLTQRALHRFYSGWITFVIPKNYENIEQIETVKGKISEHP